jgi:Na+-translocating ferredoxin:NAD+ oxidoreductase RnfG subunit
MKKLFEKPMFHYTFVLTVVALVCGIMIGVVNAITDPIIAENVRVAKVEAYERVLEGIDSFVELDVANDPSTIVSKVEGKDANSAVLGYIYEAYTTNKFGYMRLVISINAQGTILGADFIEINQTYNVEGTKTNLSMYIGSSISDLAPSGDLIAGATGSLTTLKSLLADVAVAHANTVVVPEDPYEVWFGAGYIMDSEVDPTFTPNSNVLSKYLVRNSSNVIIGAFYHLTGIGIYKPDESTEGEFISGTIHLYVGLSTDGTILGVDLPITEYGHTTSNTFYPKVVNYANSVVGDHISSFSGQDDLSAGASNSRTLVEMLLTQLGGIWE